MCTRCNQKYGGTADSQDSIALGSGLHGDFTAMTFVLHTAKLQRTTRILLSTLWNSRGNSLCNASVHFPTATTTTAKLISKTITSMSFITIRMPTTPRGNARHAFSEEQPHMWHLHAALNS